MFPRSEGHLPGFIGLLTTARQRSNSSSSESAYSSLERGPFPPKPVVGVPLPYAVVTAINFINSRATSSGFLGNCFSKASSAMLCACSFSRFVPKPDSRIRADRCLFAPAS